MNFLSRSAPLVSFSGETSYRAMLRGGYGAQIFSVSSHLYKQPLAASINAHQREPKPPDSRILAPSSDGRHLRAMSSISIPA